MRGCLLVANLLFCLLTCGCNSGLPVHEAKQTNVSSLAKRLKPEDKYSYGDHLVFGELAINTVSDSGFDFTLIAANGGNQHSVEGVASFQNDSTAIYVDTPIKVIFSFRGDSVFAEVEGTGGILGIDFNEWYVKGFIISETHDDDSGVNCLDPIVDADLKLRAGTHYHDIADCMNKYSESDIIDGGIKYKVYYGGIEGLFTLYESEILTRDSFYFVGLVVADTVHLYTNDPLWLKDKNKIPKTMEEWIPKMEHKDVVYHSHH